MLRESEPCVAVFVLAIGSSGGTIGGLVENFLLVARECAVPGKSDVARHGIEPAHHVYADQVEDAGDGWDELPLDIIRTIELELTKR